MADTASGRFYIFTAEMFTMRKLTTPILVSFFLFTFITISYGSGNKDPHHVTFIKGEAQRFDFRKQHQFRNSASWKSFSQKHKNWKAVFDERTGMPHRAYGEGFALSGSTPVECARNFIAGELSTFQVADGELTLRNSFSSAKYHYVDYYQTHRGLEVLNSRVTVRMTNDFRLVLFGADVYHDIGIGVVPAIGNDMISNYAAAGIGYAITGVTVEPGLKVLPVPVADQYEYHLVYEATVQAADPDGFPARYYTLVDANSGAVLYRQNQIVHLNDDLVVQANVSDPDPYAPEVLRNLAYLRVKIDGTDYYTDETGTLDLSGITLPADATLYLQGTWSKVVSGNSGNVVASFSQELLNGNNVASFDASASLPAVSAYYHVNVIHDFMKAYLPDYTEMDEALETRVERTDGTCNAYYDGSSINFYSQGGGCYSLALTGDVVYHEYGHGIDMRFHDFYGNGLSNGAINEGYSDVWGFGVTDNPIIGIGISSSDPNAYVRRYDIDKKVYPQDIQGESHADGEIIAGCWYDTRLNIGSVDEMMKIFAEALFGLADGFDGQEGSVFTDVLIDALTADDDNGNINDGTPNGLAILNAFALHGITLIGDLEFEHTEPLVAAAVSPIVIQAELDMEYPIYFGEASLFYKLSTASQYDSVQMDPVSGVLYEALIPGQQAGTIIDYYFRVKDLYGATALLKPADVLADDPNLPYKVLVGYQPLIQEDLEFYAGDWNLGDVSDNALTGHWVMDVPVASYLTVGVPSSQVQTGLDHTPSNSINVCAFTGNANLTDGAGTNDVDGGRTSMYSPKYDLTEYQDPAISYYRWFSNDQGATPGNDPWRVSITNGDGSWVTVEHTHTADHSWRANALRVADYVDITDKVQLKFVASDSIISILDLDGQSLVEAAVDDLTVWDLAGEVGVEEAEPNLKVNTYPNPANDQLVVHLSLPVSAAATLRIVSSIGEVMNVTVSRTEDNRMIISTAHLAPGLYTIEVILPGEIMSGKFMVMH